MKRALRRNNGLDKIKVKTLIQFITAVYSVFILKWDGK